MQTIFVCVLQGKFQMLLKAQRMIDETPVCQMNQNEKEGTMRVKPTTFNAAVNVKASVLCPTCDCEKVDKTKHKMQKRVEMK